MTENQNPTASREEALELEWKANPRWEGTTRDYSASDVVRLQGRSSEGFQIKADWAPAADVSETETEYLITTAGGSADRALPQVPERAVLSVTVGGATGFSRADPPAPRRALAASSPLRRWRTTWTS